MYGLDIKLIFQFEPPLMLSNKVMSPCGVHRRGDSGVETPLLELC